MNRPDYLLGQFVADGPCMSMTAPVPEHFTQVLDCFDYVTSPDSLEEMRSFMVVADNQGMLAIVESSDRSALPTVFQEQLIAHQALCSPRCLMGLQQLYLLDLEALAPMPDTPGMDDPLWLVGRLLGPFDLGHGEPAVPVVHRGKLISTRGELLEAALLGAPHAMHLVGQQKAGRCYHLLLPGDGQDIIRQGRGAVLAYPHPGPCDSGPPGNAPETARLLHDTLIALQDDLRHTHAQGSFADQRLPRPLDRLASGDPSGAPAPASEPGWLERLMGLFIAPGDHLSPLQGRVEDFLRLTSMALAAISAGRSQRMQALQQFNRLTHASWTPAESMGMEPVATPGNGAFTFESDAIMLPGNILKGGGIFNFRFDQQVLHRGAADLQIEVQYFDGDPPGTIALCYRPAGSVRYGQTQLVTFTGSGQWRTLRATAPGALLTRSLWYDCDFGFYCVSTGNVRLRKVRVALGPSSAKHKTQVGMDWTLLTLKPGGRGWLDHLGYVPKPSDPGAPYIFPRWPDTSLPFDLTIADEEAGNSEGEAFLVLSNDQTDYSFPAPRHPSRPDLEMNMGPAFKDAGRAGVLVPEQLPQGIYHGSVRLLLPGRTQYVEAEGGLPIELVEKGHYSQILAPGGRGWLDALGGRGLDREINEYGKTELQECLFSGWMVDEQRKKPDGQVGLILKSDALGTHYFDSVARHNRQDVVDYLKEPAYLRSGFSGLLKGEALPPGTYKCLIRMARPDWLVYVEFDTGKWIKVVEDGVPPNAETVN